MLLSLPFIVQMRIHTCYLIRGTARHSMVDWIIEVLFHARSIKQFDNGDENNIFILYLSMIPAKGAFYRQTFVGVVCIW